MPEKSRILVIDDDLAHGETAAESLERAGYAVRVAAHGQEGLRLVDQETFDLVLTDLVMRDVTGLDVVRAVKAFRPSGTSRWARCRPPWRRWSRTRRTCSSWGA